VSYSTRIVAVDEIDGSKRTILEIIAVKEDARVLVIIEKEKKKETPDLKR